MKKIVDKDNLVFIALIYNYIGNKKTGLSVEDISSFIDSVDTILKITTDKYAVSKEPIKEKMLYRFGIKKERKNQRYVLNYIDLEAIDMWYDIQPLEVLSATLHEKSLLYIDVKKENLQIKKECIQNSGTLDVYSPEYRRAITSAKRILACKGCENIIITSANPDQLEADKGYHVSYRCNKPYEKALIKRQKY